MYYIDICRSKDDELYLQRCNENKNILKTAATSLHLAEQISEKHQPLKSHRNGKKKLALGDSWFGSVDYAAETNEEVILNIKQCHSRFPLKFLKDTVADWPSGSYLNLEAQVNVGTSKERKIYAIGYKYCKSKGSYFVFTEGAAHTECHGDYAYTATGKDETLNTNIRKIPRPYVVHLYYTHSNIIDVHNQCRQYNLKLEKHWVVWDGFFRIITSLFGITVVDCWNAYKYHMHVRHRHKDIKLRDFVNMLAKDMLENNFSSDVGLGERALSVGTAIPRTVRFNAPTTAKRRKSSQDSFFFTDSNEVCTEVDDGSSASPAGCSILTVDRAINDDHLTHHPPKKHIMMKTTKLTPYLYRGKDGQLQQGKRLRRRGCVVCDRRTIWYCATCPLRINGPVPVCYQTKDGRNCVERHCSV